MSSFDRQQLLLLRALDEAHRTYYETEVFSGPSLHFHLKSLEAARHHDFERFVECVYAMLASWGMHRMGPGGSKMRNFANFQSSMRSVWSIALPLQNATPSNLGESDWRSLKTVFSGICCMESGTSLVGNSKVLAHLVPNLVPPVDREYTLKFWVGHGQITTGIEIEWNKLRDILEGFFVID